MPPFVHTCAWQVVVVGPSNESELVLAYVLEGFFDALNGILQVRRPRRVPSCEGRRRTARSERLVRLYLFICEQRAQQFVREQRILSRPRRSRAALNKLYAKDAPARCGSRTLLQSLCR